MANEAFARVEIAHLLKSADRALIDGGSVRFGHPLDDAGKVDYALCGCQDGALTALKAKRTSVNSGVGETQKAPFANA